MTDRFVVTEKMMQEASTYISLSEKEAIATVIANACVVQCKMTGEDGADEDIFNIPAPPMHKENTLEKTLLLTGCFLHYYLHVETESMNIPIQEYDGWAGAHLMNQIERFKSTAHKTKAFDMLSDYRDLEKRVNCAIYARLNQKNDPCRRLLATLMVLGSEESMNEAQMMVNEAIKGMAEEQRKQDELIREAGNGELHEST